MTPLDGIRVLDVSGAVGAYASRLLGILGADVLLVEPPGGDPLRHAWPRSRAGAGLGFAYYHAGQRSTLLDVTDEASAPELARLADGADVVLVSPGATPLAGYDEATTSLAWVGDDTIVCAITPFGLTGPNRRWRATPFVSYAMAGGMYRMGTPEGPPLSVPGRVAWDHAGAHATIAVLAALLDRGEVGGQWIDLAVHEVFAEQDYYLESYYVGGKPVGGRQVGIGYPPTGTWACADGEMDIGAHQRSHWGAFLDMLGRPEELLAPALEDAMVRRELFDGLVDTIAPMMAREPRSELVARGQAAGLPCAPWNTPLEFVGQDQLAARGYFVDVEDPASGTIRMPGRPVATVPPLFRADRAAPRLGDDDGVTWRAERVAAGELARPLRGLRVLSFGAFVAGNMSARALAELGADVVKIEARDRPEVLRMPAYSLGRTVTEPSGVTNTVMYAGFTRGVRGLALDMHTAVGRALFRDLARRADVVIENFGTADEMAKWGCAFEDLREINPELVMLSLSGYGRSGPLSAWRAYGTNISAFTGLSAVWGQTHGVITDYLCAVHGVVGLLAGIVHARRRHEAVSVDAAQIETTGAVFADVLLEAIVNRCDVGRRVNESPDSLLSGAFRCAGEDRWVAIDVVDATDWNQVCSAVERPDLSVGGPDEARALREKLCAAVGEWTAPRSPHTCARLLQAAGVAAGAVQDVEDVARDPALRARGSAVEVDQPDLGVIEYPASFYRMSRTPVVADRPGPRLGQHTFDVLHEWLGLDHTAVDALVGQKAVFVAPE